MLRSPEIRRILRYPNFTMVGHHYVLPVAKDHRGEVQGSVLRTSASNETVYVEPTAISEQSAQLSFLRAREAKEVRRILRWLSAQVGMVAESLRGHARHHGGARPDPRPGPSQHRLSDVAAALQRGGEAGAARRPASVARGTVSERSGRLAPRHAEPAATSRPPTAGQHGHECRRRAAAQRTPQCRPAELRPLRADPLGLRHDREPRIVTPIDVNLGLRFQILVVTGPNTGGKTVALKTVGLLAIMAQAGLHVPAGEGSQFPIFDDVLTDIGDEQSLEQSLSTFSSHVGRIREILGKATPRSLVLLDELGAGTDPTDGAALGRAILDELDRIGCRAIVTTHIGDLKTYALSNARAENAAVEFDDETFRPRYRLRIGDIGVVECASRSRASCGLPEHVVARAEAYLAQSREWRTSPDWEGLLRLRKEAEAAREAAILAQAEAERTREALAERIAELQKESQRADSIAEARARLQPGDRVVVPRLGYDRPGRLVKLDPRKKIRRRRDRPCHLERRHRRADPPGNSAAHAGTVARGASKSSGRSEPRFPRTSTTINRTLRARAFKRPTAS